MHGFGWTVPWYIQNWGSSQYIFELERDGRGKPWATDGEGRMSGGRRKEEIGKGETDHLLLQYITETNKIQIWENVLSVDKDEAMQYFRKHQTYNEFDKIA